MSRYIDIDKVLMALRLDHKDVIYIDKNDTAKRIEKIQGIDIVRCKECKYFIDNLTEDDADEVYGQCCFDWDIKMPQADDFCSYGEREGE